MNVIIELLIVTMVVRALVFVAELDVYVAVYQASDNIGDEKKNKVS
jgi:hypothetical protein